tara:strand:- start:12010 stop:12306 length:297 start_codon:yes stop_codon:yes gene_type:complete
MGELSSPWDEAMDEIATLRAEVERLNYTIRRAVEGLTKRAEKAERERDEAEERARFNARLAEGLPELVRERDTLRAQVERWVKEVAHLKLAAEKAERN